MPYISPWLDVSCGESTPEGWVLGNLYYNSAIMDLFTRDEMTGYPNNGGEHTLMLNIRELGEEGVESFLELVEERYRQGSGLTARRVNAFIVRVHAAVNAWKESLS